LRALPTWTPQDRLLPPGRPLGRSRVAAGLVWLGFIIVPPVGAISNRGSEPGHALAIAGAAAFSAAYVWLVLTWFRDRSQLRPYLLAGVLLVLAITLTIADRTSWGFLFTYCAACAALVVPTPAGFPAVLVCTALAAGCTAISGGSGGVAAGYAASTVGVGLLMVLMRDLRMRNQELTEARAELANTAVAQERERFARDLHDLLGHSLSVIAIKAELARRLLPERPAQAAVEVADVEQVARQALSEVRQAVSGYRQPTLDGELEGARMALSAAGIVTDVDRPRVALDPDVEAVLAWAVREGATNVIRHSGARRCQVTIHAGLVDAAVEVLDDGAGGAAGDGVRSASSSGDKAGADQLPGSREANPAGGWGNGLAGLAERAEGLRGRIEAGRQPDGSFRLVVSVPLTVPGP
jgi:two-component system sensor histidine kinase DesK